MQDLIQQLASELDKDPRHVENVVRLLDEGNTIPFIARYRKELHGAMDDTALRNLEERLQYLRNLAERREAVKRSIEEQGKLTEELSAAIDAARTLAEVEDLYRPYKQKRRTRATIAREKGLAPLAELLFAQGPDCPDPTAEAARYVDAEKGVETVEDALSGASDIIAETISDDAALRKTLRTLLEREGKLCSQAAVEEDSVYRLYYDFSQALSRLQGHQILAVNRGEKEGFLKVRVELDRDRALQAVRRHVIVPGSAAMEFIKSAAEDAYDRLIFPALEREARSDLTERADEGAIGQFALNLKPLLMQPPVKGRVTMGLDPGYRRLFVEYLRDFAAGGDKTIFLTSHIIQDMELLIDDCMILDYGRLLIHKPTREIMENFHRFRFSLNEGQVPTEHEKLWNTEKNNGQWITYSFEPLETVRQLLESKGVQVADLKEETLSLEDAFIGLTGKY